MSFLIAVLNIEEAQSNENLFSGLDLINELAVVLKRFRVGPVAFMVDIQAKYYRVKYQKSRYQKS